MEINLFVYDKLLNPFFFEKRFRIKVKEYKPCFSYLKLYKNHYNYYCTEENFSRDTQFTFGTLYSLELSEDTFDMIKLHYIANDMLKLSEVYVTPIIFNSLTSFVNQKWEIEDKVKCYTFISNLDNEKMLRLARNRHNYCGNFHNIFLQTYH